MSTKNQLNLIFGPTLPSELEKVGLSFISAPYLKADSAIANLSAHRYAVENYTHLAELNIFDKTKYGINSSLNGKTINISTNIPTLTTSSFGPTGAANSIGASTPQSFVFTFDSTEKLVLKVLHEVIKVTGVQISQADSWYPIIKPGTVWRKYTVSALEPASGWLKSSGLVDGDEVYLIYAVPEAKYGTRVSNSSTIFPGAGSYILNKETCLITNKNELKYTGHIQTIKNIFINGVKKYAGVLDYDGTQQSSFISLLDRNLKLIKLFTPLAPDDEVVIEYTSPQQNYIYSGYYATSGNYWVHLDLNPEYGHFIDDELTSSTKLSSDALLNQVTIYAAPTAYLKVSFTASPGSTGQLGNLTLDFKRAIDYGETHFIKHLVSDQRLDELSSRITGVGPASTWGFAICGLNYYNELKYTETDIFSRVVPSMLPLSKICLTAPAATKAVAVADIRLRGGGIPEDVPLEQIDSNGGLDKVRGFWDMATWSGAALKEGGFVEIQIDESILKTDPNDPNPNKFLAEEIHEMVATTILPGVEFKIVFTEVS